MFLCFCFDVMEKNNFLNSIILFMIKLNNYRNKNITLFLFNSTLYL